MQVRENIVFTFVDMGILVFDKDPFFLFIQLFYHPGVLILGGIEEMKDGGDVSAFLDLLDVGITERVCGFRDNAAPHGCTACQCDHNDGAVLGVAQGLVREKTDFTCVIFVETSFQLFEVAAFDAGKLPQLLVIRIVDFSVFSVFKDKFGK